MGKHFLALLFATIGGVFVFIGLIMEDAKEKEAFATIQSFRRKEKIAKWGWRILMIGIAIEIVTAGVTDGNTRGNDDGENHASNRRIATYKPRNIGCDSLRIFKSARFK